MTPEKTCIETGWKIHISICKMLFQSITLSTNFHKPHPTFQSLISRGGLCDILIHPWIFSPWREREKRRHTWGRGPWPFWVVHDFSVPIGPLVPTFLYRLKLVIGSCQIFQEVVLTEDLSRQGLRGCYMEKLLLVWFLLLLVLVLLHKVLYHIYTTSLQEEKKDKKSMKNH